MSIRQKRFHFQHFFPNIFAFLQVFDNRIFFTTFMTLKTILSFCSQFSRLIGQRNCCCSYLFSTNTALSIVSEQNWLNTFERACSEQSLTLSISTTVSQTNKIVSTVRFSENFNFSFTPILIFFIFKINRLTQFVYFSESYVHFRA